MLETIGGILQVIIGFGFIIFVHELGHFTVAKKVGIRVERFSIGFGPKLFAFTRGDTEYQIAIIPLGGYVKMAGEEPDADDSGEPVEVVGDEYFSKPPSSRAAVIVAGSFMNFVTAFPLCIMMYLIGYDVITPDVGTVRPGSAGYAAGLRYGDRIVKINGSEIKSWKSWRDIQTKVMLDETEGAVTQVEVVRNGKTLSVTVQYPANTALGRERWQQFGITPGSYAGNTNIRLVVAGHPADGILQKGDRIVSINEQPIEQWNELLALVRHATGEELTIGIERDGKAMSVKVTPKSVADYGAVIYKSAAQIYKKPEIGFVRPGSPADGRLALGDVITHVDGKPVASWKQISDSIWSSAETVTFTVQGKDEPLTIQQGPGLRVTESIGIDPTLGLYAAQDLPGTQVKRGDKLVQVQGKALAVWSPHSRQEQGNPIFWPTDLEQGALLSVKGGATVEMSFLHEGTEYTAKIPYIPMNHGVLGIDNEREFISVNPGFTEAVSRGVAEPFAMAGLMFDSFHMLFTNPDAKAELSGPIGILTMSFKSATSGSMPQFLWLLAFISINLSIINMFPIPVLDGGHMLFIVIEKLRGKPVSEKIMIKAQFVGLALLLSLMLFATYNDILDWFV